MNLRNIMRSVVVSLDILREKVYNLFVVIYDR